MKLTTSSTGDFLEKSGFWSLCIALFLLSFPRSWSLYPLGAALFAGFGLWIINFKNLFREFCKSWYLILPPVVYFIIHLISVVIQGSEISILEDRLMFLLIPVFGFPVFAGKFSESKSENLFSAFIYGIILISSFLLIRILYLIYSDYPGSLPFFSWLYQHELDFFSIGFSIIEHPTYLALKVNWVIVILLFSNNRKIDKKGSVLIIIFLSAVLFFLASKAGLAVWFIMILVYFIGLIKNRTIGFKPYLLLIPVLIFFVIVSVLEINRINLFVSTLKTEFEKNQIDFKNIDQRTREWYSAVRIIAENPVFGTGLSKAEDRMIEEYHKNGFNDEAALKLNAHNQFLEAQMTFGIAGLASLSWMLLALLIFRKRSKDPGLAAVFFTIMTFCLLFESMFNRQWGMMFFLIFYFTMLVSSGIKSDSQ